MEKRSLEDAGRTARYRVFERLAKHLGARCVATAHTRDDHIETVLMRLLQNARWEALTGIPLARPLGTVMVIRPVRGLTRTELIADLRARGLGWREDPTNLDRRILRNRLRLDVLPALVDQDPQLAGILASSGEVIGDSKGFLWALSQRTLAQMARQNGTRLALPLDEFRRYPREVQRCLVTMSVEAVTGMHQPLSHVLQEDVIRLGIGTLPGRELNLQSCLVRRGYDALEFLLPQQAARPVRYTLPIPGRVTAEVFGVILTAERMIRSDTEKAGVRSGCEYFDAREIGSPLEIRPWQPGDWLIPAGLSGKKKLQDLFVDAKVPRWDRGRIPLVVDAQGRIVWVIGHRVGEPTRVTAATEEIVRICVSPIP
jgi:tRNA(Ile)-lysidine synthase